LAKNLNLTNVTIASSGTVSTAIQLQANRVPVAITIPAAFSGTSVTFQASFDDATYFPVYDEGTLYTVNVGTSRHIGLKRVPIDGIRYVKVISTAGGGETASRTIGVISGE
jgi:hypothetical protein